MLPFTTVSTLIATVPYDQSDLAGRAHTRLPFALAFLSRKVVLRTIPCQLWADYDATAPYHCLLHLWLYHESLLYIYIDSSLN